MVNYTYDDLYRLTREDISDPVNGPESITYTYDAFGNRLTKSDSSGTINYTYDENDRLTTESGPNGTTTYTYDDNGNNIQKSNVGEATDYYYDYENRLFQVQTGSDTLEYEYDADGIRVSSTKNSITTTYLVDKNRAYAQVLEEKDSAGNLQVEYIHGDDLISQNRDNGISYYHYDGLGSTRALTDDTAAVTDTLTYEAFGQLIDQTGDTPNNYLFTGEQYDPNVGFYYLRARYYAAGIGRFVTLDPWMGNISDPVSLHKYLYANGNPINRIDPSGAGATTLEQLTVIALMSIIIVAAVQYINSNQNCKQCGISAKARVNEGIEELNYYWILLSAYNLLYTGLQSYSFRKGKGEEEKEEEENKKEEKNKTGKCDRHSNQKKKEEAYKKWKEAKEKLDEVEKIPNKSPDEKKLRDKLKKQVKHWKKKADWPGSSDWN